LNHWSSVRGFRSLAENTPKNRLGNGPSFAEQDVPQVRITITPDLTKRVDFERMECPKCGEKFQPNAAA